MILFFTYEDSNESCNFVAISNDEHLHFPLYYIKLCDFLIIHFVIFVGQFQLYF